MTYDRHDEMVLRLSRLLGSMGHEVVAIDLHDGSGRPQPTAVRCCGVCGDAGRHRPDLVVRMKDGGTHVYEVKVDKDDVNSDRCRCQIGSFLYGYPHYRVVLAVDTRIYDKVDPLTKELPHKVISVP